MSNSAVQTNVSRSRSKAVEDRRRSKENQVNSGGTKTGGPRTWANKAQMNFKLPADTFAYALLVGQKIGRSAMRIFPICAYNLRPCPMPPTAPCCNQNVQHCTSLLTSQ